MQEGTFTKMKQRSRTNFKFCYICESKVSPFITTPILELPDGTWEPCCEDCADKEFPGWEEEE